jgi:hypothetical protein
MPQHDGTAVHSLASEHLQEVEGLVGSEREMQEEVVGVTMGSMYQGVLTVFMNRIYGTYKCSFSRHRNCARFWIFPRVSY